MTRIGVPKEIKNHEYRVAITPIGVRELTAHGHDVLVEASAGVGSSISDEEYAAAGAKIVVDADEVWAAADMVLKVKETDRGGVPPSPRRPHPVHLPPPGSG